MSLRILGRTIPARVALGLAAAGVLIMAGAYVWSLPQIYSRVESIRLTAGQRYGGDKVSALIALARDNQAPYRLRNEACWALGQLGDPRALPVLRKLDTDEIQAKPWKGDRYIVQYTVEKSLRQINAALSLTRWMYAWLQ